MRITSKPTLVLALLFFLCSPRMADAQNVAGKEDRTLETADSWPIHITYFASGDGKESPVVILIPGVEGFEDSMTRKVWQSMAMVLQKDGFAVVTVDLRKHGDSIPVADDAATARLTKLNSTDYQLMATQDLEAVKTFLVKEHQNEKLNIRKLGVAAAGSSCMVAAAFAFNDWNKRPWPDAAVEALKTPKGQDVRAIMMLSPKSPLRGINTPKIVKELAQPTKGIAVNIYFNPSDRAEKKSAESVFRFLKLKNANDEGARLLIPGPTDKTARAEGYLIGKTKADMEKNIGKFFGTYVKERKDVWKTRTSRLER